MHVSRSRLQYSRSRRAFLRQGLSAGAAGAGISLLTENHVAVAKDHRKKLTSGDVALLRFAAAAEIIESDLWTQYNELGGVPDNEVPGGSGNPIYTSKLKNLDEDFPQYIHDNADDEISHFTFLNAYLMSKGVEAVNLDAFRTLPGSTATGSSGQPRLTNLTQLTVDTSWWTRYRSSATNPDLDPSFAFPLAVAGLARGSSRPYHGPTAIWVQTPTFRRSPTPRHFTWPRSNRAGQASIRRWRSERRVSKSCES